MAVVLAFVVPLAPAFGLGAIAYGARSLRAGTPSRWRAGTGIALGVLSALMVVGWLADGGPR